MNRAPSLAGIPKELLFARIYLRSIYYVRSDSIYDNQTRRFDAGVTK